MSPSERPLRVVSYNIHKGVRGLGLTRRLEIYNLAAALQALGADLICLQEVRRYNRREERHFVHWPRASQADFLAPPGYASVYHSNAITRHGEHGNALLSRWPVLSHQHEDISDHRFEQRGLLHVQLQINACCLHVLVVHLGLIHFSRGRQLAQLLDFVEREIEPRAPLLIAGDFNEGAARLAIQFASIGVQAWGGGAQPTFPARLPLAQLDHVFYRGLQPLGLRILRGRHWWRMSDHLPLVAEFVLPHA